MEGIKSPSHCIIICYLIDDCGEVLQQAVCTGGPIVIQLSVILGSRGWRRFYRFKS